jgi:hypothetical protein
MGDMRGELMKKLLIVLLCLGIMGCANPSACRHYPINDKKIKEINIGSSTPENISSIFGTAEYKGKNNWIYYNYVYRARVSLDLMELQVNPCYGERRNIRKLEIFFDNEGIVSNYKDTKIR